MHQLLYLASTHRRGISDLQAHHFYLQAQVGPILTYFAQEEEAYAQGQSASSGEHFLVDGNHAVFAMSSHDHWTTVNAVTLARPWVTSVSTTSNTL
jgi:hypothetical protein